MGKIKKGILGGFSGKVGNVVGAYRRGVAVMRSLPGGVANPRTPKQMEARRKFSALITYVSGAADLVAFGFNAMASGQGTTPFNYAFKYNYPLVSDDGSVATIDKTRFLMGRGYFLNVDNPQLSVAQGTNTLVWRDNTGDLPHSSASDSVVVAAFNSADKQLISYAGIMRSDSAAMLTGLQAGKSYDIYVGTVSEQAEGYNANNVLSMRSTDMYDTSNIIYVGTIVVP